MSRAVQILIQQANARGYSVANLFQLMDAPAYLDMDANPTGEWQAQFRKGREHYGYGRGETMEAALEEAMKKAGRRIVEPKQLSLEDML